MKTPRFLTASWKRWRSWRYLLAWRVLKLSMRIDPGAMENMR